MGYPELPGGEAALEADRLRQMPSEEEPSVNAGYLRNLRQTERPGVGSAGEHAGSEKAAGAAAAQGKFVIPDSLNPRVVLVVLTAFFQQNETLSREQFFKLIENR